jgi:hypothetical protein
MKQLIVNLIMMTIICIGGLSLLQNSAKAEANGPVMTPKVAKCGSSCGQNCSETCKVKIAFICIVHECDCSGPCTPKKKQ